MIRVAVDARPLSFPTTGIGRYTQSLLSRLFSSSDWVWYLYSDRPLLWPESLPDNVKVRYPNFMLPSAGSMFAQVAFPVWAKRDQVDLFWSPRHHLPLFLGGNVRSIVTIHDLVWKHFPETMSRFGRILDSRLMPPSVRNADKVIAVSGATRREVEALSPEADVVTILEAPFLNGSGRSAIGEYFLFVGTLEPRKNLERLLSAYADYVSVNTCVLPLKICGGKGWGLPELERLIQQNNLSDQVEVLGYVDDATLPALYQNARALLMPSLYEGFGLPIVEAFSQGTPVLTSNRGAMKEVAGDGGLLVDPENIDDMASAIARLTDDQELVEWLQLCAHARTKEFSWDTAAEQTLTLMESLLPS
ncbi:glycosyltransferase family 1 protein [Microbulbifer sp. YPW1]|uniref:glycosyltransferase family 4 protein n=1 Tax=Microbulbifer sp. YPW1 TaxID=2745199 RepID=UPI00159A4BBA|nr:glycosyltransferase family 1 protein [Microbulbifer sp. YPW1]QKX18100.1 glycosyltransferase family 4 protein [Microbulbifer sp. YPW1]